MLSVKNLVTSYGNIEVLRKVSLEAVEHEITCMLGPNGAGKTTTMFTLAGILKADAGSVILDGDDVTDLSAAKVVSRGIALVPENRLVFPRMSVEENLHTGAFSRKLSAEELAADTDQMYQQFPRLAERRNQLAGTLSGGEQQMLAIARGLMTRPRILLMDEPSVGLAPLIVEEIFELIQELNFKRSHNISGRTERTYGTESGSPVLPDRKWSNHLLRYTRGTRRGRDHSSSIPRFKKRIDYSPI